MSMSTSRSSNSSIKNPYGYSSSSFLTHKKNSNFEFNCVKCKCDIESPCQEAWREGTLDLGRRFFGCSHYKDPTKRCDFFLWADPPYTERAREVIKELKAKLWRREDDINNGRVELHFVESKMNVLNEECIGLRKKNEEPTNLLKEKEK